jgi:GxxExxY protein
MDEDAPGNLPANEDAEERKSGGSGRRSAPAGRLVEGELSGRVIGAAVAVHRALGPGFLESIYEGALVEELRARGIAGVRQLPVDVTYRGAVVGRHRLDLLIEDRIVVELKAIASFAPIHEAILLSYLRAANQRLGLLLNFAAPKLQIQRVINPDLRVNR